MHPELPSQPPPSRYPGLAGRVVVVTGGASGIGAALVARFAEQGCRVAFLDIQREAGDTLEAALAGGDGCAPPRFFPCDLADIGALRGAVAKVTERLGPVRILVNNAANDSRQAVLEVEPEDFDRGIHVNLRHQFFAAQAVLPGMVASGGGAIVNIGSHAWYRGAPGMPVYLMAKAGVVALTRGLAREFGPHRIRVNHVVPGWVMTARQRALWWTPEADEARRAGQCIPDEIEADDVAQMALFLASDAARACTNQTYFVDAGRN